MKATGINIEWGSPAGYCARGINRCFGGQIFEGPLPAQCGHFWDGRGFGVMSSEGIACWSPPLLEWFPSRWKLWNEEQIGAQWEAPVIPKPSNACSPLVASDWTIWVWDFHLSGVGRAYSNWCLPVNILRSSVTPLTSVLSVQRSCSHSVHLTPWQCWCTRKLSEFIYRGGINQTKTLTSARTKHWGCAKALVGARGVTRYAYMATLQNCFLRAFSQHARL